MRKSVGSGAIQAASLVLAIGSPLLEPAAMAQTPPAGAAAAPAASSDKVEVVLVTARRREETLQDVPEAVSAFGADLLADKGASDPSKTIDCDSCHVQRKNY